MSAHDTRTGLKLSLLDRLADAAPDARSETPPSSWEQARQYKESLCRDLAALLNTRRAEQDFDPMWQQATNSLLTFGVSDFTSYNLKNGIEQERVRRSIERSIRQFEPRLAHVTVTLEEPDALRPVLRFQVAAVLTVESAEPVLFDVTLHRDSRRIGVSGASS
jgi:type VI secretion system protein ImpF